METRPLGISILSALHFFGGIAFFVVQIWVSGIVEAEPLRAIGLTPTLLAVGMMFLSALGVASGIGMWRGYAWGWWLGAFYYVYSIFRHTSALITLASMADELSGGRHSPAYHAAKFSGRIIVAALILLYLFRGRVLTYFGLEGISKWKALSCLIGIATAVTAAAVIASLLI